VSARECPGVCSPWQEIHVVVLSNDLGILPHPSNRFAGIFPGSSDWIQNFLCILKTFDPVLPNFRDHTDRVTGWMRQIGPAVRFQNFGRIEDHVHIRVCLYLSFGNPGSLHHFQILPNCWKYRGSPWKVWKARVRPGHHYRASSSRHGSRTHRDLCRSCRHWFPPEQIRSPLLLSHHRPVNDRDGGTFLDKAWCSGCIEFSQVIRANMNEWG